MLEVLLSTGMVPMAIFLSASKREVSRRRARRYDYWWVGIGNDPLGADNRCGGSSPAGDSSRGATEDCGGGSLLNTTVQEDARDAVSSSVVSNAAGKTLPGYGASVVVEEPMESQCAIECDGVDVLKEAGVVPQAGISGAARGLAYEKMPAVQEPVGTMATTIAQNFPSLSDNTPSSSTSGSSNPRVCTC